MRREELSYGCNALVGRHTHYYPGSDSCGCGYGLARLPQARVISASQRIRGHSHNW